MKDRTRRVSPDDIHVASGACLYMLSFRRLTHLSVFQNPWYIIAAVGFSASNRPEGVPCVFQHVVEDLKRHHEGETLQDMTKLLVQKLREVLFKSGLVSGYSKVCGKFLNLWSDVHSIAHTDGGGGRR